MFIDPKTLKPGQKIKQTVNLMLSDFGGIAMSAHKFPDYILVAVAEVEFTVPESFNAVAQAVDALDNQITNIQNETQAKLKVLREKKAQLLQITYQGADILDAEIEEPK